MDLRFIKEHDCRKNKWITGSNGLLRHQDYATKTTGALKTIYGYDSGLSQRQNVNSRNIFSLQHL